MSNGTLYKFGVGYSFQDKDRRVIDSNAIVADKLERLSAKMQERVVSEPAFGEEFAAGLTAVNVESLLTDDESLAEGGELQTYLAEDGEGGFREGIPFAAAMSEEEALNSIIKVPQAQNDPEEIQAQAQRILEIANAQAEEIVSVAKSEAEEIKQQAYNEARETGYQEGLVLAQSEYDKKYDELEEKSQNLDIAYENKITELEPKFVETLTDIYEHIFHVKYSDDKEVIFYLIKDAMRNVEGSSELVIHVSSADFGFVSMQRKELLSGIAGAENAEIVEDTTLGPNECFIETGSGIFDCSLETQLSGLKRELRLLSYSK